MTKANENSIGWRSRKAEQKFRQADNERWQRASNITPTAIDVPTSFGSTRVHHWPGDGPDIVFLHGLGDTSYRWVQYAEALPDHNVFAVDTIGEPGESKPRAPIESADQYAPWFRETLDGLGLANAHIVGHSMGGFIALSYASTGGHAASYVLFEPVGVVDIRIARFVAWGALAAIGAYCPGPVRRMVAKRLRYPVMNDKADFRTHLQAQRGHPMKPIPLPVQSDEELESIGAPIRLLAGAATTFFDVAAMVRRIDQLPNGLARLVPDAGHALTMSHFDDCLGEIRAATATSPSKSRPSG